MWREYSLSYMKRNKASSISVIAAAFIAALFLSLVCSLFYNFWIYEIERIVIEEGDWQGRITGVITDEELTVIKNFANVQQAQRNGELSQEGTDIVDVWFHDKRAAYETLPQIRETLGIEKDAALCHETLLSRYLVHDPEDETPPLLMSFYLAVLLVIVISLILIIHNAFAVSMNARIRQFGIFSGVGATPGQIFVCLLQEASALCALPVLLGSLAGIGGSWCAIQVINVFAEEISGRHEAVFQYHALVFAGSVLTAALTVLVSACLPAKRLSALTPLQAIQGADEFRLSRKKRGGLLALLFGIEGELAANALTAQKKALRTSTLSLTLSFLAFTVMLCFFTLSAISTNHTYFERYQDAWDVMVTLKDTAGEGFLQADKIRRLDGVRSSTAYQKTSAVCCLSKEELSDEVLKLGGLTALAGSAATAGEEDCLVKSPVVILDDQSFTEYCGQLGVELGIDGSIVLNRIWDSQNSSFRYKKYIPYVREDQRALTLQTGGEDTRTAVVPVLAYTDTPPVLREEYENYALVQFVPLSLWNELEGQLGGAQSDLYIRVLAREGATLAGLNGLQDEIARLFLQKDIVEIENRLQEKIADDDMRKGSMLILGAFCVLLAIIGIANVFSNTLGFLRQRKREYARYASVGMTPQSMRKMFAVEALAIAGRPLLLTLPLTAAVVTLMITASDLDPMEFIVKAPIVPILLFCVAVFGFVALAYYIGGKRLLACDLAQALRNDTV